MTTIWLNVHVDFGLDGASQMANNDLASSFEMKNFLA
jgi:hypothetical protein